MNTTPQLNAASSELQRTTCCPGCQSTSFYEFFAAKNLPVHVGNFYDTRQLALDTPRGDIRLAYCHECGLTFNRSFDPSLLRYEPGYEVGLQFSPTFQQFTQGVVNDLIERFELKNKRVMEIGCGNAYFLRLLCELGDNHGIGFDPTVVTEGDVACSPGSMELHRQYFDASVAEVRCDFACCLSVFEHVPEPAVMLNTLRTLLAGQGSSVYFEVFNAMRAISEREVWSIHYEQCNCFGVDSLANLFRRCGFHVSSAGTCYEGDQYNFVEATINDNHVKEETKLPVVSQPKSTDVPKEVLAFEQAYAEAIDQWTLRLNDFRNAGERVVVWGSGGKGISFLNTLDTSELIRYVVEINPNKQGKYIPGTGQEIVSPEFLREYQPTKIIITNPLYENEMKQQAASLGVQADFLIA